MTSLKIRMDTSAPGSFLAHRQFIKVTRRLNEATTAKDGTETMAALDALYDIVIDRLYVEDASTTVDAEIAKLSVDEFQAFVADFLTASETVPTTSSEP